MASSLEALASNPRAMASNLRAMASNLRVMASSLEALASNPRAMASNLRAMASNLRVMASSLEAMASNLAMMVVHRSKLCINGSFWDSVRSAVQCASLFPAFHCVHSAKQQNAPRDLMELHLERGPRMGEEYLMVQHGVCRDSA